MGNAWKLAVVSALIVAGCSGSEKRTTSAGYMQQADARFHARYVECGKIHKYDPNTTKLAQNTLGPTERAWQQCVYAAVEKYLIPASKSPDLYRGAIATSRNLTNGIEKGTITRDQRRKKMDEVISKIESVEGANAGAATTAQAERTAFTRRMVNDMRGM